ncbi:thioredoxin family protein [Ichthyenterobacterium magnum]|uniref:Thioredoxin-like protein n=1 Tax=Ichthyenterobacterium magnum TaxID=1230530 RepID=A0A420DWC8_9FLAO|nr:thioredoxin family protein [Ichthyenterobacterium magnum]RKE98524.1 thioredoxin-like protein [Ichthyenterobacterium magnum]
MVNNIIEYNKEKTISYQDYRDLVKQLVEDKSTTGNEKTEALVEYTMLNDRRMKRWDKTVKVSEEAQQKVSQFKGDVTWVVLTESWCGDAAHVIPVINKIAELNDGIDLKFLFRDENEALMNQFLTNGGKAIPKLIMIDNTTGDVVNTYGPRPTAATKLVNDYKEAHGKLTPEFKEDLQRWYNKDKGQSAIEDLLQLL